METREIGLLRILHFCWNTFWLEVDFSRDLIEKKIKDLDSAGRVILNIKSFYLEVKQNIFFPSTDN